MQAFYLLITFYLRGLLFWIYNTCMTYIARNTLPCKKNKSTMRPATRSELLDHFIRHHDAISIDDLNKLGYGGNLNMALTYSSRRVGRMIVQITPSTWHIID